MPSLAVILVGLLSFYTTAANARWMFDYARGSAINIPTPLTISQTGQPDIHLKARYSTRPISGDAWPYYMMRISFQPSKSMYVYGLELLHHKIYLDNTTSEVSMFKNTFGFNMLFVNFGWDLKYVTLSAGLGPLIVHPRSTVRGQGFEGTGLAGKYSLVGVAGQGSAVARLKFLIVSVFVETKLTIAYGVIPVANGNAKTSNIALHGLVGAALDL